MARWHDGQGGGDLPGMERGGLAEKNGGRQVLLLNETVFGWLSSNKGCLFNQPRYLPWVGSPSGFLYTKRGCSPLS
ncbi:unnamed protein product [Protopolystoma xenopodis]|uniref:Uncharacterized protein n=1 Tax=Protopolystoma xenopodis TaxID=117903 RepID=A0A3S5BG83_9PLAT|nr:unnamed protein product [Protopolystoma xenopodis]